MSDPNCIFCKIASGQIPCLRVYEDDHVLAFMDIGPVSDGHVLVISKEHHQRLDQMSPEAAMAVGKVLPAIAGAVQKSVDSEGYNLLCNNGSVAGQVVEHVHFHVIPRNANDGLFSQWPSYEYPEGKAEVIVEKIRQNLSL
ncbi:MAG: HIT family protein [Planctomycetota bacterium]|jgi:histidine triad (HIT) family protein